MCLQYSASPVEHVTELFFPLSLTLQSSGESAPFRGQNKFRSFWSYVANKSFCDTCMHAVVKLYKSGSNIVRFMWETN